MTVKPALFDGRSVMTTIKDQLMRPEEWIIYGDTGTSSKTIWAVMMSVVTTENAEPFKWGEFDVPRDPSDFNRCLCLLEAVPEWRGRLHEVAEIFPEWRPMVSQWDRMERLFKREAPTGKCPDLFVLMQLLRDEGHAMAGWKEKYPGWWEKTTGKGSAYYGCVQ